MRSASALIFTLLASAPSRAVADVSTGKSVDVRLDVSSSADCGSKAELIGRVRARTERLQFVDSLSEPDGLWVRVRFEQQQQGVLGEMFVVQDGQQSAPRRLSAPSCADALDGMALILAVTLDSYASGAPSSSPLETVALPAPALPAPASAAPASAAPVALGAGDDDKAAAAGSSVLADTGRELEAPREALRGGVPQVFGAFAGGHMLFGPAATGMPGVSAHIAWGWERDSLSAPALLLGGAAAWSEDFAEWGGTASFAVAAATIDLCALRLRRQRLLARACASALLGQLSATGRDTLNAAGTVQRPFVGIGVSAVVQWRVVGPVVLELRAAPLANLIRDEFEFRPRAFQRVPPLSLSTSLGIGVGFQ